MDALINTSFFEMMQQNRNDNIEVSYKDYICKVYDMCKFYKQDMPYHELIFTFTNTLVELKCLREMCADGLLGRYIPKAIMFTERSLEYIIENKELYKKEQNSTIIPHRWTSDVVHLVEIIYAFHTSKCIDNGDITINELARFLGCVFGIDIKNFYIAYSEIKRRKNSSRTYFLDELSVKLRKRLECDEERQRIRR